MVNKKKGDILLFNLFLVVLNSFTYIFMIRVKLVIATLVIFSFGLNAQKKGNKNKDFTTPSILDNTELYTGFFNFNYHSQKDELFLSVDKLNQ